MKRIIFIHGRDFIPKKELLQENWYKTIAHALKRDFGVELVEIFDSTKKEMAYYGDKSNIFLDRYGRTYNEEDDIIDREKCISKLYSYKKSEFTKDVYKDIPFENSLLQSIASFFSKPLLKLGFGYKIVELIAPDMKQYWNADSQYGSEVREALTDLLSTAMDSGDDVLLVSHSLGTMISYDVLWKFSYYSEYKHLRDKKLGTWITFGSPLGDEIVKKKLKGAKAHGARKYPINIDSWYNIAAKDDFVAHDKNIKNDFKNMDTFKEDISIYNLSIRHKISDPHHAVGYLVTPQITKIIASWLQK